MAIKIGDKIVSDKELKKMNKPKTAWKKEKTLVWQTVWFLYNLDWYQWKVVEKIDDDHYLVDATCCNIHKKWEKQQSIQPANKLTVVDDDY